MNGNGARNGARNGNGAGGRSRGGSGSPVPARPPSRRLPPGYVALFPGLGGRPPAPAPELPGLLAPAGQIMETVDGFARRTGCCPPPSGLLTGAAPPRSPGRELQHELLLYGLSLTLHTLLAATAPPVALLGHSLGFLPALVGAGAFGVEDGCRLVLVRHRVLAEHPPPPGGMLHLDTGADTAAALAASVPGTTVACVNSPVRTVLSGPAGALAHAEERARGLGLSPLRLPVRHAYHGPGLEPALTEMRRRCHGIRRRPLTTPLYSATTGTFHGDDEDLLDALFASVARPVHFRDALRALAARGATAFVECGPTPMLTRMAEETVPRLPALPALHPGRPPAETLRSARDLAAPVKEVSGTAPRAAGTRQEPPPGGLPAPG